MDGVILQITMKLVDMIVEIVAIRPAPLLLMTAKLILGHVLQIYALIQMETMMIVKIIMMMEEKASAQAILKRIACGLITACGPMLDVLIMMVANVKTMTAWTNAMMVMKIG